MIISQETADKSLALIRMQKERIAELEAENKDMKVILRGIADDDFSDPSAVAKRLLLLQEQGE